MEDGVGRRESWQVQSPDEMRHALILAIAKDCLRSAPLAELAMWKHLVLTATIELRLLTHTMDMFWQAVQIREDIGVAFELLYPSSIARVFQIADVRAKTGSSSVSDLWSRVSERLHSTDGQKMTPQQSWGLCVDGQRMMRCPVRDHDE
jgi:hypothetical protein